MYSIMLKAKIHLAVVTDCQLEYEGSLTIDRQFMDMVGIRAFEKVMVANAANGERFETYAIAAPAGSRTFCLNGATAHKGSIGDRIIIFTFAVVPDAEVSCHRPRVLVLKPDNEPAGPVREMTCD